MYQPGHMRAGEVVVCLMAGLVLGIAMKAIGYVFRSLGAWLDRRNLARLP